MSKKIDYQNLSSNIIKNSEVTTEDMDETHLTKFFRKTKRKIFGSTFKLCLVVIIIFLLVIFRIRSSSLSSIPNTIMSTTTSVKPTDFYSNAPNIIFHKTHKTGSSSIQNIMYRLGLKHRMPILWGKHGGTGIGYPASFNTRMVINKEKTARISTNHMRNSDELLKMFDERRGMFQFTILRHPYSHHIPIPLNSLIWDSNPMTLSKLSYFILRLLNVIYILICISIIILSIFQKFPQCSI